MRFALQFAYDLADKCLFDAACRLTWLKTLAVAASQSPLRPLRVVYQRFVDASHAFWSSDVWGDNDAQHDSRCSAKAS